MKYKRRQFEKFDLYKLRKVDKCLPGCNFYFGVDAVLGGNPWAR